MKPDDVIIIVGNGTVTPTTLSEMRAVERISHIAAPQIFDRIGVIRVSYVLAVLG